MLDFLTGETFGNILERCGTQQHYECLVYMQSREDMQSFVNELIQTHSTKRIPGVVDIKADWNDTVVYFVTGSTIEITTVAEFNREKYNEILVCNHNSTRLNYDAIYNEITKPFDITDDLRYDVHHNIYVSNFANHYNNPNLARGIKVEFKNGDSIHIKSEERDNVYAKPTRKKSSTESKALDNFLNEFTVK